MNIRPKKCPGHITCACPGRESCFFHTGNEGNCHAGQCIACGKSHLRIAEYKKNMYYKVKSLKRGHDANITTIK